MVGIDRNKSEKLYQRAHLAAENLNRFILNNSSATNGNEIENAKKILDRNWKTVKLEKSENWVLNIYRFDFNDKHSLRLSF